MSTPLTNRKDFGLGSRRQLVPVATVLDYAGATAPDGYLMCDGAVVRQEDYSKLFTVIGTTYNTGGEASYQFRLPDLRGRTSVGAGSGSGLTTRSLSARGGVETVALSTAQMPSHTHVQDPHVHAVEGPGGHSWGVNFGGLSGVATFTFGPVGVWAGTYAGQVLSAMSSTATNQYSGGGGSHENMPPFVTLNKIIKF